MNKVILVFIILLTVVSAFSLFEVGILMNKVKILTDKINAGKFCISEITIPQRLEIRTERGKMKILEITSNNSGGVVWFFNDKGEKTALLVNNSESTGFYLGNQEGKRVISLEATSNGGDLVLQNNEKKEASIFMSGINEILPFPFFAGSLESLETYPLHLKKIEKK